MFKEYMADALLIVALRQFWFRRMFFLASKLYQKNRGYMLTAKIGINRSDRSDQAVWLVWCCSWSGRSPTGLTGGSDRSDRFRRSPTVIRVLNRFRYINRISCGVNLPHPINIKGHGRLKGQRNRIYQKHIFYLFTFTLLFQSRHVVLLSFPWRLRTS